MDSTQNLAESTPTLNQIPFSQTGTYPLLLTEEELIRVLRIPEISKARDYHYVIENLMRMHDLPCIHISRQPLFPIDALREWIAKRVDIRPR